MIYDRFTDKMLGKSHGIIHIEQGDIIAFSATQTISRSPLRAFQNDHDLFEI